MLKQEKGKFLADHFGDDSRTTEVGVKVMQKYGQLPTWTGTSVYPNALVGFVPG